MKESIVNTIILSAQCFTFGTWAGHTNELLEATLDGREEAGDDLAKGLVGDPDGKGEAYVFGVDGDPSTLCYSLAVEKVDLVAVGAGMATYIHEGVRDSNGLFVTVLAGP